jgi:hypothetical protein
MKYLKMLGLAAIAALGLMAFVGASTASATTLCKATDTPDCTPANTLPAGTTITSTLKNGGSAKLTGSGGETIATCTGGEVAGKTTNTSATWIEGNIEKLTWTGCSQMTTTVKTGKLDIDWVSGTHNGIVRGTNNEVTVAIFGVSCVYGTGAGTTLGTLSSGAPATLNIATTVTRTSGGFLCPQTAGWDAEYVVTNPKALYVTT